jgi:hypothetical protein
MRHRRPRHARARHRALRTVTSLMLVLGAVTVGVAVGPVAPASAVTGQGVPPPCPQGYSCVTIPCASSPCPTVEAGPTSNLGASGGSQYVFVDLYDFPAGDAPAVWYCADSRTMAKGPPLCSTGPGPLQLPQIGSDGTAFVNYQVEERGVEGNSPFSGEVPGEAGSTGSFFCDDGADPCALDVVDQGLDGQATPDSANTAVVPVSFVASSSGCAKGAVVSSESDFGIEGLLTEVAPAACSGPAPAVPVNTAENSMSAVEALASGTVQIAFTDDPQATDEQGALDQSKNHYDYIPVAASADVVGFSANDAETTRPLVAYPDTSFELTPNMVAGLISLQYSAPGTADPVSGVSCANPEAPPKNFKACPALQTVNLIPGFVPAATYWGNVRSDNAGVTDEFFEWLCQAQDRAVTIDGQAVSETRTAAQVLEAAPWTDKTLKTTCPSGDQFPALSVTGDWAGASSPAGQARDVANEVANAIPSRTAAFATMNWYEALYYGLDVAELQNAAGQYVAPSAQSVDAALADASVNPSDGVVTNIYTNSADAAAYPTPVVIYAVVPTGLPAATAGAVGTELRSMLAVTAGGNGSSVPPGLLPLPAKLASAATTTVNADFPAPTAAGPGPSPTTGAAVPAGHGPPGSLSGSPGSTGSEEAGRTTTTALVPGATFHETGSEVRDNSPSETVEATIPPSKGKEKAVQAEFLGLVAPGGRWLLMALLGAGAVAILIGPAVLGLLRVRRRPGSDGEPEPEGADGGNTT